MSADRPEALRRVPTPSSRPRKVEDVAPPSVGSVALQCTKCQKRSVVSMVKAAKLAFPSVYVPAPGRTDRVWMKCPACKHRAWIHVKIKG
jgi:hypothetical protein